MSPWLRVLKVADTKTSAEAADTRRSPRQFSGKWLSPWLRVLKVADTLEPLL
jgi:hypothetical protein